MYIILLDQGDYLEDRGNYDWGRTTRNNATIFPSIEEAEYFAKSVIPSSFVKGFEEAEGEA